MLAAARSGGSRWGVLPPWITTAIVAVICRLPVFFRAVFDEDESQYATIGELVRRGGQLYGSGGVDNKPPGIYWTYAGVFELAGRYAMWAVHLLSLVVVIVTAWLLGAIATRLANRRAGLLAGVFYAVFTTVYYPKMLAANTELFMMLALSAMALLVVVAREVPRPGRMLGLLAGAGAMVAVASAYKQSAAVNLAVIAASVIATRAWFARLVAAGLGFAAMLGAGVLAVMSTSSLPAMWHWCVTQLGKYGTNAWHGPVLHNMMVGLLPFIASSLVVWVAAAAALPRLRGAPAGHRILWAWLAVSLASAFAGGHFFGHYFIQPLSPLSVIAAVELDRRLATAAGRWLPRGVLALTVLPAVGFFAINLTFEPVTETFGAPDPDYRAPIAWVRAHTAPEDRILVWGSFPSLYVFADRLPATRFVGFMRGSDRHHNASPDAAWDMGPEVWPALAEDFAAHPPAIVLDTSTADYMSFGNYPLRRFPEVAALLRNYQAIAVVGGVTMYARPGTPLAAASR